MARLAGPGISFLVALGFQLSGFENVYVAIALWAIAVVWGIAAFLTWQPARVRVFGRKSVRFPAASPHGAPSIGPSPFPRTPLERAVLESITAAETIKRERAMRGDQVFSESVIEWSGETDERLEKAEAGELRTRFRSDGLHPPHGPDERSAYLDRQIALLEQAHRDLRRED